jgi:copper(I)-binding protein
MNAVKPEKGLDRDMPDTPRNGPSIHESIRKPSAFIGVYRRIQSLCLAMFLSFAGLAHAAVTVKDAWVRGTVPAQKTTGAFATLTSTEDAKLVAVKSPIAKTVEVHRSEMHGGMMHMEAVDAVPLPAGKAVELEPGGFHVMLIGLTRPIPAGMKVPLEFVIEDAKGKRSTVSAEAPVRPLGQ